MCWIGGLKYTKVGVATILNQSSTIYILILAAIFLQEPFTRRKLVASLVALAGIVLVTCNCAAGGRPRRSACSRAAAVGPIARRASRPNRTVAEGYTRIRAGERNTARGPTPAALGGYPCPGGIISPALIANGTVFSGGVIGQRPAIP